MMSTNRQRVAVVGSAQTVAKEAWSDRQHVDLISEAVTAALLGTGLRIEDVDFVIDSGSDFLDGRSISNCGFLGAMGAHHKEESRIEEDGLWAALYAMNKIASGSARVGLVVAYSKSSESDPRNFWSSQAEPFSQRPVGLDQDSANGLMAQAYLSQSGISAEALRDVAARNWKFAIDNPMVDASARMWDDPALDEVVASPLLRRDLARPVDGAVAVVIGDARAARQIGGNPAWLVGAGAATDQHFIAARDLAKLPAAGAAGRQALRNAGLSPEDIGIAEICGQSTVGELQVLEALGLAEPFRGADVHARRDGVAINESGGALPADVVMASGLIRLHEAASVLSGRSARTYEGRPTALAHGTGGLGMQNHCVMILEAS